MIAIILNWLRGTSAWLVAGVVAALAIWGAGRRSGSVKAKTDALKAHKKTTERMQDADGPISDDPGVLRDWLRARGKR